MNKPLHLTAAECSHILSLLTENERDGWYYGPRMQYWTRAQLIKEKMQEYIREPVKKTPCAPARDVVQ